MIRTERSYWESLLYDQKYDLIIIGAGISGQSTALFFKKEHPDARVLILDRGLFPIGASTRNAGFACFGTIGEHLADLEIEEENVVRQRIARRYNGLLLLGEVLGDEAIDYEHSGGWEIFTDDDEFATARGQVDRFNEWMEELTGEKEVYKAGRYRDLNGIFNREEGMLHPGKLVKELHRRNLASGVEYRWGMEVQNLDVDSGLVTCKQDIRFSGEHVVVATNAFTRTLLPEKVIKPGRGYVFVTSEMSDSGWKGTFHYNKGYVYFRNLGESRILLGGGRNIDQETEETGQFGVNQKIREYLIGFANDILKLPEGWQIEQEWSGIMGFTPNKSPEVERVGDKAVVVAGLSGMGVALGMQLGKEASALI